MKMLIQFCFTAIVLTLILAGCKTIRGGGWINSITGEGKATFGIDMTCEDSLYYGEFTYRDNGFKVVMPDGKMRKLDIKAWVDPTEVPCGESCGANYSEDYTKYDFTYKASSDKYGKIGLGTIEFWDADRTEDPSDVDKLCIELKSGPYVPYLNCGELQGGNLTIYDD